MPNTHVPAAGETMAAVEGMHIITGRFSRRRLLVGLTSVAAMGAATTALALPAPLTLVAPSRESTEAKIRRIEALLDTLPPELAAAYCAQLRRWIDHIVWMNEGGAPRAEILAYIRGLKDNDGVFAQFKAKLSGATI
ncbi:hypothetical protein FJ938_08360 [Mesorhizobium sp. B2-4-14]|uniref:hypothetical protein n=1 Tax=Mesorhizobium sp. B2-4-14 TaxID=2589935 RepID=UPI001126D90F|nr:hypothetical protein [Mesorhizobium sp. B2-4-14]TPL08969.1 hypothetical protein FJ938_08360 [Mesorhizobium sp. B2-4-14]